jgi:hypothetical protein
MQFYWQLQLKVIAVQPAGFGTQYDSTAIGAPAQCRDFSAKLR